jgi:hypothetical protein
MSMQTDCEVPAPTKRGRKLGGHNKPGHKAGRPKKPTTPSAWSNGRVFIKVLDEHIRKSLMANSSHCTVAMAIKSALPDAKFISVDIQSVRFTQDGTRFTFLTPHLARAIIINTDQDNREAIQPCEFSMKPVHVAKAGKSRRHVPTMLRSRRSACAWPRSRRKRQNRAWSAHRNRPRPRPARPVC